MKNSTIIGIVLGAVALIALLGVVLPKLISSKSDAAVLSGLGILVILVAGAALWINKRSKEKKDVIEVIRREEK